MTLWFISFVSFFCGMALVLDGFGNRLAAPGRVVGACWGVRRERAGLERVLAMLQELEETLGAGVLPPMDRWEQLRNLRAPWGRLTFDSFQELRSQGAAVLPTLRRLRTLAESHREALGRAQAKSSQAIAQAGVVALLVPAFGTMLYSLLPGIPERRWSWLLACLLALISSFAGAVWMLKIADAARWAGLREAERPWLLAVQCSGERFLSLVRGGQPADLAWAKATEFLAAFAPELALEWGYSIWGKSADENGRRVSRGARGAMIDLGVSIRKSVQVSLMEGRPCTERVELALRSFGQDLDALIDRELTILPNRVLKPVFICLAPAVLGLLGFGIFLAFRQVLAESGGVLGI